MHFAKFPGLEGERRIEERMKRAQQRIKLERIAPKQYAARVLQREVYVDSPESGGGLGTLFLKLAALAFALVAGLVLFAL